MAFGVAGLLFAGWVVSVQCYAALPRPLHAPTNVAPPVWKSTAESTEAEFLVILAEQTDLSPAAALLTREERLRYVYDALRETALRSQALLRVQLEAAGVDYRPFYVVNMLAVKGNRALVTRLATHPDVARIAANPRVRLALPTPSPYGGKPGSPPSIPPTRRGTGIEWNVARINAADVWALGHTGQSIVVAGQDTGYAWDHPALINQYRGYDGVAATHDYNWHDAIHTNTHGYNPCGVDSPEPCDDNSHGTHTMGTIVGDDGGDNQIGVAPGARWISCRNMDNGWGTPATYAECFEFFLAPYPIGGDPINDGVPGLAPHVINNSWTCPPSEGCDWDTLQTIVENVRAAGIVVVASAGNSGSECETIQDPPAIYDAAFSVGATNSSDDIASFSSRGPVTRDGSGRLKPDVSAPGVGVRSSIPGGGYSWKSGTSMAGPHAVGTVALLWSATPSLIGDVDGTERVIAQTARSRTTTQGCGGDGPDDVPNNVYGWGIVDALAAVLEEISGLEVTKQAHPDPVLAGAQLTYTISLTNTGNVTLTATITDVLPDHATPTGVITWTPIITAPGAVWTETVVVTVETGYIGPLTNIVQATSDESATSIYTATVHALGPHAQVAKRAQPNLVPAGAQLSYTLCVTNTSIFTLTQVILTDVIPVSTTFARASGNYTLAGNIVTWTATTLAPDEMLAETLVVTVAQLPPGTRVVNVAYGVQANELLTPVVGAPVDAVVPWRYRLFPIFRNWSLRGGGGD
ncbi:MAG: S8 family serine peptidase [Chloroflexota bacterium]|nr:S8 family serine peptidase [Chloroflexota bacterium]